MPERRVLKQQSEERIQQLIQQFPAIKLLHLPETSKRSIRVQRPDTGMMHFVAENLIDNLDRHWLINFDLPDYKGDQWQYLCAIDDHDSLIDTLWFWNNKDEREAFLKDIFTKVGDPQKVKYLLLITSNSWYSPEYMSGQLADGKVVREVSVIVFQRPKKTTWKELIDQAVQEKKEREEAYLYFPKEMPIYPGIEKMLHQGWNLHAFSSGGGLRVVSFSKKGTEKEAGYGEAPHIEEALAYMEEDIQAGGIPYGEMYGKKHPHYLTGESLSTSNIDYWIRRGSSLDVFKRRGKIHFRLNGYNDSGIPQTVRDKAESKPQVGIRWRDRGYVFETTYKVHLFANGGEGYTTKMIRVPFFNFLTDRQANFYHITKTGIGADFWDAYRKAVDAPEKEVFKLKTLRQHYWAIKRMLNDNLPRWKNAINVWFHKVQIRISYNLRCTRSYVIYTIKETFSRKKKQ